MAQHSVNPVTLFGFRDEMEQIARSHRPAPDFMASVLLKEAGFMANVGKKIVNTGVAKNVGNTLKTMALHPVEGMKKGLDFTVRDMTKHPVMSALMVGGTVLGANAALRKDDLTGRGQSRFSRAAEFAGGTAGGLIGAPHGFSGGVAGSLAGAMVGKKVGSIFDRLRGYRPPQPAMVAGNSAPTQSPAFSPDALRFP
jgi:hypothetical protein